MKKLIFCAFAFIMGFQVQASPNKNAVVYSYKNDNDKIKSCLSDLYRKQIEFRKAKGYFATLPNQLNLNQFKVCDGLEISTHFVSQSAFKMTAKFNQKVWSVDQSKTLRQIH